MPEVQQARRRRRPIAGGFSGKIVICGARAGGRRNRCRRAIVSRHLSGQHPDPRLLRRHGRDHRRHHVGLLRHPDLRPVGIFRHRRLCAGDHLHGISASEPGRRLPRLAPRSQSRLSSPRSPAGFRSTRARRRFMPRSYRSSFRSCSSRSSIPAARSRARPAGWSASRSFDLGLENWFRLAGLGLMAVAVVALIVMRSDTGRLLAALRDNDARCTYLGIDTSRTRIVVLTLTALVAGLPASAMPPSARSRHPRMRASPSARG